MSLRVWLLLSLLPAAAWAASQSIATIYYLGFDTPEYFTGLEGDIVTTSGDMTQYAVHCPRDEAKTCIGRVLGTTASLKVIAGPSTYVNEFSDLVVYQSTTCSLTRAPTPTQASCQVTITRHLGSFSVSTEHTILVGGPDATATMSIYPQPLTLVTDAPTGGVPASTGSGSGTGPAQTASPGTKTGNLARPTAVAPLALAVGIAVGAVLDSAA